MQDVHLISAPTGRTTFKQVSDWLNGRSIHVVCMDAEETAAYLRVPVAYLTHLRNHGKVKPPHFCFGGRVWYEKAALLEFLLSREAKVAA